MTRRSGWRSRICPGRFWAIIEDGHGIISSLEGRAGRTAGPGFVGMRYDAVNDNEAKRYEILCSGSRLRQTDKFCGRYLSWSDSDFSRVTGCAVLDPSSSLWIAHPQTLMGCSSPALSGISSHSHGLSPFE